MITNKGLPENLNTILNVPKIKKDWTLEYKDTPYFPNSVFPVELYMYRKETPINLKLGQTAPSKFAENNLSKEIYIKKDRKTLVKNMVDVCRQYMNRDLENELAEGLRFYKSMKDDDDKISLEYHCEIYETVKTFNDMLSILFLHFSNIISYPNETFYERYKNNNIRIKPAG